MVRKGALDLGAAILVDGGTTLLVLVPVETPDAEDGVEEEAELIFGAVLVVLVVLVFLTGGVATALEEEVLEVEEGVADADAGGGGGGSFAVVDLVEDAALTAT